MTADGRLARDVSARVAAYAAEVQGELDAERRALPGEVAALSGEARRLLDSLGAAQSTRRGIIEARLDDVGRAVAAAECRLAEIERTLLAQEDRAAGGEWVASVLQDFDAVEPASEIEVRLHDLDADGWDADDDGEPASAMTAAGAARKEASP